MAEYRTQRNASNGIIVTHVASKTIVGIFNNDHEAEQFVIAHRRQAEAARLAKRNEQLRANLERVGYRHPPKRPDRRGP